MNLIKLSLWALWAKKNGYTYYTEELKPNDLDYNKIAGLDLGLNNLVTVATNQKDIHPIMVNGRPLKSINQHWNKQKAK